MKASNTAKKVKLTKNAQSRKTLKENVIKKLDSMSKTKLGKVRKERINTVRIELNEKQRASLLKVLEAASKIDILPPIRKNFINSLIQTMTTKNVTPSESQLDRLYWALNLSTLREFPDLKGKHAKEVAATNTATV